MRWPKWSAPARCWNISESGSQRALVLGGTGHIGAAIARQLASDGWQVTAAGRTPGPRANLEDTSVTVVGGDDCDPHLLTGWAEGTSLIVDAATPYPLWLHDKNRSGLIADAVRRTQTVTATAQKTGAGFVHISSFTTLPRPAGPLEQISQGVLQGLHSYFDLKRQVERTVMESFETGLPGTVLNPSTCFGPYDLKPKDHTFIPMLLEGKVGGLVRHDLNVVDVRDVAAVASAAVTQGFPHRQVPVFGHNIALPDLARQICQMGGVAAPSMQLPSLLGMAGMLWLETAYAAAGRKSPYPSLPMLLVRASYAATPSAAQLSLAGNPRPLERTLRDALSWYRAIGRA